MIPFFKKRTQRAREAPRTASLGPLEVRVMEIMWERGESCVRDVAIRLGDALAYTTVMTTLDRLYKKGLLDRRRPDRAFLYTPLLSRGEWERRRASELVAGFLAGAQPSRELLVSCLIEAVGQHDETLLDELERKVRSKRRELMERGRA
jgi:predicted transcriptional regulator